MKEYFLKVIVHVNCLWTEQIRSVLLRWLYHYRGILSLQLELLLRQTQKLNLVHSNWRQLTEKQKVES